ncbi:hypothetical protein Pelo_16741 [Pelomyxa schiedti]|nr:hypothetical protein Pelo_16741 [Pelomyxa schiedti]
MDHALSHGRSAEVRRVVDLSFLVWSSVIPCAIIPPSHASRNDVRVVGKIFENRTAGNSPTERRINTFPDWISQLVCLAEALFPLIPLCCRSTDSHKCIAWYLARYSSQFSVYDIMTHSDSCNALAAASISGHFGLVKWMTNALSLKCRFVSEGVALAVVGACAGGKLEVAQWLVEELDCKLDTSHYAVSVVWASSAGHLDVVYWLVETFSSSALNDPEYVVDLHWRALGNACNQGHLPVADYLFHHFNFEPAEEDFIPFNDFSGNLEVMQWALNKANVCSQFLHDCCCTNNVNLEAIQLLFTKLAEKEEISPESIQKVFNASCKYGHFEVAKWLFGSYPILENSHTIPSIAVSLKDSCSGAYVDIAEWLVHCQNPDGAVDEQTWTCAMEGVSLCQMEDQVSEIIHWLIRKLSHPSKISREDIVTALANSLTHHSDLTFPRWLVENFKLTTEEISTAVGRSDHTRIISGSVTEAKWLGQYTPDLFTLESACCYGNIDIAKWLAQSHHFTACDAINSGALPVSCRSNYLDCGKWLVEHFSLADESTFENVGDKIEIACHALCCACELGSISIASWITRTFALTPEDIMKCRALSVSCYHPDVTQWLVSSFSLSKSHVCIDNVFQTACTKNLRTAQWLTSTFLLSKSDVTSGRNAALREAALACRTDVCKWLIQEFRLSFSDVEEAFKDLTNPPARVKGLVTNLLQFVE